MGTVCPHKKSDDPNIIEDRSEDSRDEDNYFLGNEVKNYVVVIYIDPAFPNSIKAKELLESINTKPLVKDIKNDPNPKKLRRSLKKLTGDPAPPYVFIGGKYFGGYNEIDAGIKNHIVQKTINSWLETRVKFGQN